MIAEIQCSELLQFGFTDETKIINSCTSDCIPILTTCEYNDAYKSPFFKTGQTKCYSNLTEITCPTSGDFYGQEPNFNYTPHDYEAIANGEIIKDNATGLMWETATPSLYGVETEEYGYQECAAQTSCKKFEATFYCSTLLTLGGYNDWRLPTAVELSTITDYGSATHMYSDFTNTNGSYWTKEALLFSSTDGTLTPSTGSETANIKCVRSVSEGSDCTAFQCQEKTADSMFIFDSPNTVMTATESAGSIIFNFWRFDNLTVGDTWKNAIETCSSFDNLNGLNTMRLPTVNELMWLIDRTNGGSLIRGFAGTAWTSTTVNTAPSEAYAVDFLTGSVIRNSKDSSNIVICIE